MDNIHIPCEICEIRAGYIVKGGIYATTRGVFIVCEVCEKSVDNTRKEVRKDGSDLFR